MALLNFDSSKTFLLSKIWESIMTNPFISSKDDEEKNLPADWQLFYQILLEMYPGAFFLMSQFLHQILMQICFSVDIHSGIQNVSIAASLCPTIFWNGRNFIVADHRNLKCVHSQCESHICVFPTDAVNGSTGCWPRMCECENQFPNNSRAASTATGVSSFQFPVSSTVSRQQCRSRQWSEWSFPTCATLSRRRPPPATALSCSPATATRSKLSFYPTWRPIYRFGCQYKRLSRLSWLGDEDDNLVPTDNVNRAMAPNSWQIEDDQI